MQNGQLGITLRDNDPDDDPVKIPEYKGSVSPTDSTLSTESKQKNKRAPPRKWSAHEDKLFLEALDKFGRDWRKGAEYVGTRDHKAFSSHAQKYFIKLCKEGKPLPDKVRESGDGYTLSGKPLDKNSASARAYGLAGAQGRAEYRQERKLKKLKLQESEAHQIHSNMVSNDTHYTNSTNSANLNLAQYSNNQDSLLSNSSKRVLNTNTNIKKGNYTMKSANMVNDNMNSNPVEDHIDTSSSYATAYNSINDTNPSSTSINNDTKYDALSKRSNSGNNSISEHMSDTMSTLPLPYSMSSINAPSLGKYRNEEYFDSTTISNPSTPFISFNKLSDDPLAFSTDASTYLYSSPYSKYTKSPLLTAMDSVTPSGSLTPSFHLPLSMNSNSNNLNTSLLPFVNPTPISTPNLTSQSPVSLSPFINSLILNMKSPANFGKNLNDSINNKIENVKGSDSTNESNGTVSNSLLSDASHTSSKSITNASNNNSCSSNPSSFTAIENISLGPSHVSMKRKDSITCSIRATRVSLDDTYTNDLDINEKEGGISLQREASPISPTVLDMNSASPTISPTSVLDSITSQTASVSQENGDDLYETKENLNQTMPLPSDQDCVVISSNQNNNQEHKKNIFTRTKSESYRNQSNNTIAISSMALLVSSNIKQEEKTTNKMINKSTTGTNNTLAHNNNDSMLHIVTSSLQLYKCQPYSILNKDPLFKRQPFQIYVDLFTYMLLEIHSHSSYNEIAGYFVGSWDNNNNILFIQSCYPRNCIPNHQNSSVHYYINNSNDKEEQDMIEFITKNKLQIVGMYHSHPSYESLPSEGDISFQYKSQLQYIPSTQSMNTNNRHFLNACGSPFVGCIISPYLNNNNNNNNTEVKNVSNRENYSLLSSLSFYHVLYYKSEYVSFQLSVTPINYNTIQYISIKTYIQAIYSSVNSSLINWNNLCIFHNYNSMSYKYKLRQSMLLRLLSFDQLYNQHNKDEYIEKCTIYIDNILQYL